MLDSRAAAEAITAGHEIELDLLKGKHSVIRHIIALARREAIAATQALIATEPTLIDECRRLRNDALRFNDFGRWVLAGLAEAEDAYRQLDPDEQEMIDTFLSGDTEINDA